MEYTTLEIHGVAFGFFPNQFVATDATKFVVVEPKSEIKMGKRWVR